MACEHALLLLLDDIRDKTTLAYAYLCTNFVSLFERTGRSVRAIPKAKEALKIQKAKYRNKNDLANAFSDVGYVSIAAYQAEEGLEHLEMALMIAEESPEPDRYEVYNVDRFLRNHGRGNVLLQRYEEASADFAKAQYYRSRIHGPNSHYDGE